MEKTEINIGKYTIRPSHDYPDGSKSVWIEQDDGEGGQFPVRLLEEVIKEFYNKHF